MNIQKFTQKSVQAVNELQKIAYEYGNQEVEQEHLLMSLLRQEDSAVQNDETYFTLPVARYQEVQP